MHSYRHYRVFLEVCEKGSLTLAANSLSMTVSAVSHTLSALEKQLGFALFRKKRGAPECTLKGRQLYEAIREPFKSLDEKLDLEKERAAGSEKTPIAIASTHTIFNSFFLPLLPALRPKAAEVLFRTMPMSQAIEAVREGAANFGAIVAEKDFSFPEDINAVEALRVRDMLVCHRDLFWSDEPVLLEDLQEVPLISIRNPSLTFSFYQKHFSSFGENLIPLVQALQMDLMGEMAAKKVGAAFLHDFYAEELLRKHPEMHEVPLRHPLSETRLFIFCKKDTGIRISTIFEFLVEEISTYREKLSKNHS